MKKRKSQNRSGCPIATTLDLVGDKWTFLLVRDMLNGKSKFSEFLESPERITTSVLANRLEALTFHGLATRTQYQPNPPRHHYALTQKGADLAPILLSMCAWANHHYKETWPVPDGFGVR